MSDLEFYATAATQGDILGARLGDGPERWEEILGSDFLDDAQKSMMRRDYGLIEVTFAKSQGSWESVAVSLQVHRLAYRLDEMVPPPIAFIHGAFSAHVRIRELRKEIEMRGGALCEVADSSRPKFVHYREASSGSSVYVVNDLEHASLEPGHIWAVSLSRGVN